MYLWSHKNLLNIYKLFDQSNILRSIASFFLSQVKVKDLLFDKMAQQTSWQVDFIYCILSAN